MCIRDRYYVSLINDVSIRTDFAKAVTDAYEFCGQNKGDSKQMDFHNNAIGRKIYADNTDVVKIGGLPIALNEPSNTLIKSLARQYVEKKSCFLRKSVDNESANRDYSSSEIKNQILEQDDNTVVYFKGTIASPWIDYVLQETYVYMDCEDGDDEYEVEIDGELICRIPKLTSKRIVLYPCSKNN